MEDCKSCATPMSSGTSLTNEGAMFPNPSLYQTNIGSLQYLTYTRPNVAFVVNKLSQFLASPKIQHWLACKRMPRYLKGTFRQGLVFTPSDLSLIMFTDATHAGCKVIRGSTSDLCVFLGKTLLV